MSTRLTKKQNENYKNYIINCINSADYDIKCNSKKEKLQFLFNCFYNESFKWNKNRSIQSVFTSWLQGLPSSINIAYINSDIIELARKFRSLDVNSTEKENQKILDNYFNFITAKIFRLFKKHKIDMV